MLDRKKAEERKMEKITLDSRIYFDQGNLAVCLAVENLKRDMSRVLCPGEDQMTGGGVNGTPIRLVNAELPPEMWELELKKGELLLKAGSPLGFVYGIYEISRSFLGVQPFWFWNDQAFETKSFAEIPDGFSKYSMHMTRMRHPLEDAETLEEVMKK